MVDDVGSSPPVAPASLESVVRILFGDPSVVVADGRSCRPLGGGAGEGLGLYRLTGIARVGGDASPWALVLKVHAASDRFEPSAWDYPAREALAYSTGLLANLPGGLAAPRFIALEEQPGGTIWLWLEEITDSHPGPWPLDRYASVARILGRFNGAYLTEAPLPQRPWLARECLRQFIAPSAPYISELGRGARGDAPPLARQLYPPPVVSEFERLWAERERFLSALAKLPQVFCHNDAFRRNLMFRTRPDDDGLVAIDWAYAGHGAVGEDLGQLVVGSSFFFEVDGADPHELEAACFAEYMAGLRDVGWAGDERAVRLGFAAAAALRHTIGLLHLLHPALSDPAQRPMMEELFGRPLDETVVAWGKLWPFQFGLAEEARKLLRAAG